MPRNKIAGTVSSVDEDAPELTEEYFAGAEVYEGNQLVRRGRPPLRSPKKAISLRVDADVLERYRAGGEGWQGRMNEALRKAVGL